MTTVKDPYTEPGGIAPTKRAAREQRAWDGDPGPEIRIPPDAFAPVPTEQPAYEGEVVWLNGPGEKPDAVRGTHPSGIAGPLRGMWLEIILCPGCGMWFPREARRELPDAKCPRCTWSTLPPADPTVLEAMSQLRWRLDQYRAVRNRDNTKEYEAFLALTDTAYRCGPSLLKALEALYGNQVVVQAHQFLAQDSA